MNTSYLFELTKQIAAALAIFVGVVLAGTMNADAATVDLMVSDDRTITDLNSDGVGDGLLARDDKFLRTFGVVNVWRSAIEFDLARIFVGGMVTKATLSLRGQGTSTGGRIDVFGYAGDGVVSEADGSNTGNIVADFTLTQSNGSEDFALDVTAFIQELVQSREMVAGFLLASEIDDFSVGGSDICSSTACDGFGPRLTADVAAVPVPAAVWLFGSGLLGLAGISRGKKA